MPGKNGKTSLGGTQLKQLNLKAFCALLIIVQKVILFAGQV
jgi:hypothetical protein